MSSRWRRLERESGQEPAWVLGREREADPCSLELKPRSSRILSLLTRTSQCLGNTHEHDGHTEIFQEDRLSESFIHSFIQQTIIECLLYINAVPGTEIHLWTKATKNYLLNGTCILGGSIQEREQGLRHSAFYDLASGVTQHHFHHVLFIRNESPSTAHTPGKGS